MAISTEYNTRVTQTEIHDNYNINESSAVAKRLDFADQILSADEGPSDSIPLNGRVSVAKEEGCFKALFRKIKAFFKMIFPCFFKETPPSPMRTAPNVSLDNDSRLSDKDSSSTDLIAEFNNEQPSIDVEDEAVSYVRPTTPFKTRATKKAAAIFQGGSPLTKIKRRLKPKAKTSPAKPKTPVAVKLVKGVYHIFGPRIERYLNEKRSSPERLSDTNKKWLEEMESSSNDLPTTPIKLEDHPRG